MIHIGVSCHLCKTEIEVSEEDISLKGWLSPYYTRINGGWLQTQLCPKCSRRSFIKWLKTGGRKYRWLNKLYAYFYGYFWLPCELCGKTYGGHELHGSLYVANGRGHSVCFDCRECARVLTAKNHKLESEREIAEKKSPMKFCSKCKSAMVDVSCYDPEGTIPLAMEIDADGRMWACLLCSGKAEQELKRDI